MSTNIIERKLFCTTHELTQFRKAWKLVSVLRKFAAQDMAAYHLLTGKPLTPAFSTIRNAVKLAAGQHPRAAWINALTSANFGFDTLRITDKKPSPKEFKTMTEWFKVVAAMPKTQNLNLLKLFTPEVEGELTKILGVIVAQDLEKYRECYLAELAIAKGEGA